MGTLAFEAAASPEKEQLEEHFVVQTRDARGGDVSS